MSYYFSHTNPERSDPSELRWGDDGALWQEGKGNIVAIDDPRCPNALVLDRLPEPFVQAYDPSPDTPAPQISHTLPLSRTPLLSPADAVYEVSDGRERHRLFGGSWVLTGSTAESWTVEVRDALHCWRLWPNDFERCETEALPLTMVIEGDLLQAVPMEATPSNHLVALDSGVPACTLR